MRECQLNQEHNTTSEHTAVTPKKPKRRILITISPMSEFTAPGTSTNHTSTSSHTNPNSPSSLPGAIREGLGVSAQIDPAAEGTRRVRFIQEYLQSTGARALVLGISGGQDSTLAGRLCQLAVEGLNALSDADPARPYAFYALRLPYGVQADEEDAQVALRFIRPSYSLSINIKEATDAAAAAASAALAGLDGLDGRVSPEVSDFNKGNIKARQRMIAQYAIAGEVGGLVVGTDHAAEAVTGFYTKHGDGAADLLPLAGLSKRQGAALLRQLGAPASTWEKVPTADLEEDRPALPDEQALGMTYTQIDDFLEGVAEENSSLTPEVVEKLEQIWLRTRHKRHMPVGPNDQWWRG